MIILPSLDPSREVKAAKVAGRPAFSSAFGRTWNWGTCYINNVMCNYTYDTSWGSYWYFNYNYQWYKVHIWDERQKGYEPHYDMHFTIKESSK